MDLAMWQQLEGALAALEANPDIRALVIASGLQRDVFTAGALLTWQEHSASALTAHFRHLFSVLMACMLLRLPHSPSPTHLHAHLRR